MGDGTDLQYQKVGEEEKWGKRSVIEIVPPSMIWLRAAAANQGRLQDLSGTES